jgi:hypothetical protein
MARLPRQLGMATIRVGKNRRDPTPDDARAIAHHLVDYPDDDHDIWDEADQSLLLAKPQLRCKEDGSRLTVPVRLF